MRSILLVLGTAVLLGGGFAVYWLMQPDDIAKMSPDGGATTRHAAHAIDPSESTYTVRGAKGAWLKRFDESRHGRGEEVILRPRFAAFDARGHRIGYGAGYYDRAIAKLIEAAKVVDILQLRQRWSGNEALWAALQKDTTPLGKARRDYFWLNKGPWSDLDGHTAFLPDVPDHKPAGANFYPTDMTKEEFDRLNHGASSKSGPTKISKIDAEGIASGVAGGSTSNKTGGAGGKALTREQMALSDAYISIIIQRLREAHKKPDGLSDLLQAKVSFRLNSDGTMSDVRIIQSSGDNDFDNSVLAAFRKVRLPTPPANLKTDVYSVTFKMKEDE